MLRSAAANVTLISSQLAKEPRWSPTALPGLGNATTDLGRSRDLITNEVQTVLCSIYVHVAVRPTVVGGTLHSQTSQRHLFVAKPFQYAIPEHLFLRVAFS